MLWYKALRESQARFLLGLVALTGFCAGSVWFQEIWSTSNESAVYTLFIWKAIFGGYVGEVFILVLLFLGGGGLGTEKARGCAGLTLALPVSRIRHVLTRAAVGIMEVVALALVPAVVVPLLSSLRGETYPVSQALQFAILWCSGGIVIFALSLMFSVGCLDEYVAPVAALVTILVYSLLTELPVFNRLHIGLHDIMTGEEMDYLQAHTGTLVGPLPWGSIAVMGLCAILFVGIGIGLTHRQEF